MWCFHDWSQWEAKSRNMILYGGLFVPKEAIGKTITEEWQERKCDKCGKVQREILN